MVTVEDVRRKRRRIIVAGGLKDWSGVESDKEVGWDWRLRGTEGAARCRRLGSNKKKSGRSE